MKFQIFRYYLTPTDQESLYTDKSKYLSKPEAVRKILSNEIDFSFKNTEFAYRHEYTHENRYFFSKIGRQILKNHSLKIKEKFVEKKETEWPHRQVIIDTDKNIQLVAFEFSLKNEFASPVHTLELFADEINKSLPEFGWHIDFEPVIDEVVFWDIVKEHKGDIRKLKFVYHVPNLFGVDSELEKELDEAKKIYTAQTVEASIINDEGNLMIPKNNFIQDSVKHVSRGGGKYELTLKNRETITSQAGIKTTTINETKVRVDNYLELSDIISKLFNKNNV